LAADLVELGKDLERLEARIDAAVLERQQSSTHRLARGRAEFEQTVLAEHRKLRTGLLEYLRTARLPTLLTAPFIYGMIVPIVFLDVCVTIYQFVCFPVWRVQSARRRDFVVIDRHRLGYLNGIEKLNCMYCGYANGVIAFTRDVASRTELYWCPIKHATRPSATHDRYDHFLDYGDAQAWRCRLDELRRMISRETKSD
jgi:hypothetical protein